jgi:Cu+-exporting ATPase
MDTVNLKVEGMSCTNCALTIHKYLEQQGLQNVKVNFAAGNVTFDPDSQISVQQLEKGIERLGYHVVTDERVSKKPRLLKNNFQRFLFCLVFFAPLMLHMTGIHIHWLMTPYAQLALTIPVYVMGMFYFGTSAWRSMVKGIPNMNVLIALGATASFVYSLYGTLTGQPEQFMFYETTAGIITLIFLGNWLEDKSVETTQAALKKLAVYQKAVANVVTYDEDGNEHVIQRGNEEVNVDNLLLIRTGEQVPTDCKILWGEVSVNEALLTGKVFRLKNRQATI